ncbi:MAG: Smr/MutS family protein, partial [Bacteroidales bacterium]|nr:Smr/MutS family protein [Bacteroidales bacterium]
TKVVPNPVNIDINLKVTYFDINDNYRTSNVMYERAFMVLLNDIYYNEKINIPKEEKSKDVLITEEKAKQAIAPVAPQLIDRHKTGKGKAEVDLHISALRDDFSNMKNFEILHEQTEYFRSALESAIENHYKEVVFIHGIGNGTLKGTITKILKDEYPDIWFHDAPFAKYGNGAIELFLTEL